ncbi:MAG TPA: trigger factor [Dehalococcoidia bacterium]|nr:trigger factor [Dehalococcoidia bacterium]
MQVTTEKLEENQLLLNVQVEEEVVEKSLDRAYRRLVQKANIPGFRRGKAPRSMVERFIGRSALMEEALEHLLPELYQKAIEEQGIQPLAQPRLEVVQVDPVIFKAVVPLPPVVELPDYRQIKAIPRDAQVTGEQVDSLLEDLRRDYAPWEPSEGPARMGDLLTIDIRAEEDGNETLDREGVPFVMSEASTEPAPGLADYLLGLEKGDEKSFRVSYPGDYRDETWAGRHIDYHVSIKEMKKKHLPSLDDEFAKGVGEGFDSLEALRDHLRGRMEEQARAQAQQELEEEVIQAVAAGARLEFPPLLGAQEVDVLLSDLVRRFEGQGITLAQYLKFSHKSEEELREELLPRAKERVKRRLVLDKVAEAEGIGVEPEDVDGEIQKAAEGAGPKGDELRAALDSPGGRASIENMLRIRRTIARLVEFATALGYEPEAAIEEATPPSEGD